MGQRYGIGRSSHELLCNKETLSHELFCNKETLKSVLMTGECGQSYIRTKPGGVNEPTLPHRTYFTTKLIPKLKFIDDENMYKMREMVQELSTVVFSDGWADVNQSYTWEVQDLKGWT